jgi:hypothetical protein
LKNLIIAALIGFAVWHFYLRSPESPVITNIGNDGSTLGAPVIQQSISASVSSGPLGTTAATSSYSCDGRTHCSQMRSCEEATYFLKNCPGAQMDGNYDGVPCERQWCR